MYGIMGGRVRDNRGPVYGIIGVKAYRIIGSSQNVAKWVNICLNVEPGLSQKPPETRSWMAPGSCGHAAHEPMDCLAHRPRARARVARPRPTKARPARACWYTILAFYCVFLTFLRVYGIIGARVRDNRGCTG